MKRVLIETGRGVLNFIYSLMKLRRVRNRVVFISRQSNEPSEDIIMLMKESLPASEVTEFIPIPTKEANKKKNIITPNCNEFILLFFICSSE